MCVKEFLGYSCGHCAIPYLRQCPLTSSNSNYPPCKYPAERPLYTNENCHPCSRVLWNEKVLKEEEEHRMKHQRNECDCPIIFNAEERERRRTRPSKGKGKGKVIGYGDEGMGHRGGEENMQMVRDGGDHMNMPVRGGGGYSGAGDPIGQHQLRGGADNFRVPQHSTAGQEDDAHNQGWGGGDHAVGGTYEYIGYHVNDHGRDDMQQVAQGLGFPPCGFVPQDALWHGQLQLDQPGAGMKWYPEFNTTDQLPNLPPFPTGHTLPQVLPAVPQPPHQALLAVPEASTTAPPVAKAASPISKSVRRTWQRAASEPTDVFVRQYSPPGGFVPLAGTENDVLSADPPVVSSDMVNSVSD